MSRFDYGDRAAVIARHAALDSQVSSSARANRDFADSVVKRKMRKEVLMAEIQQQQPQATVGNHYPPTQHAALGQLAEEQEAIVALFEAEARKRIKTERLLMACFCMLCYGLLAIGAVRAEQALSASQRLAASSLSPGLVILYWRFVSYRSFINDHGAVLLRRIHLSWRAAAGADLSSRRRSASIFYDGFIKTYPSSEAVDALHQAFFDLDCDELFDHACIVYERQLKAHYMTISGHSDLLTQMLAVSLLNCAAIYYFFPQILEKLSLGDVASETFASNWTAQTGAAELSA